MNSITKQFRNIIFIFLIIFVLLPQNVSITSAATNATVYEYSPMLEDRGNIYFIQTVNGDKTSYNIYKLEVASGNKTKLASSKNDICGMMVHNNTLYYTSYEGEKEFSHTYSVSIDAKDKKTICKGYFICLDNSSIYYTINKGEDSKLYKRDYDSKKATLIYTGNTSFNFVKKLDKTLYFTQFNEKSSQLTLYTLMPKQTKLTILTTDKITLDGAERSYPTVSDVVKLNGDIYYQYGTYQGTGCYWYGTLNKIDTNTNTKSVIEKQIYEESIYHNDNSIFYNGTDSSEEHYQYNTKTSKTSTYVYKTIGMESFNILGDKTYCAKADGKKLITVSRLISGSNESNVVKPLVNIPYKQKKKYEYSARVKKYGDYLLIPVTCTDYNDPSRWRGICVSVTWYVANSDGKVIAQFR